ncbi:MAG: DegT/DnrJ/EryC1/StrS family aminotransferase [Patescibacteria group bacterium]
MTSIIKIKNWEPVVPEDKEYLLDVLKRREFSGSDSYYTKKVEKAWGDYVGAKHCILTNSGTSALHMAISSIGAVAGDEIIVPSFSFIASALCVLHQNLIPVFIDIKNGQMGLDENNIEKVITKKTKAIIVVHLNGIPVDIEKIRKITDKYKLILIEDACQAHGAVINQKKVGSLGDIAAFSLNKSKGLPAGEGGFFVTNNEKYYEKADMVRKFGELNKNKGLRNYNSYELGWMYKTSEFVAAIAYSHLKYLDIWNKTRVFNVEYLNKKIKTLQELEIFYTSINYQPAYWRYAFKIKKDILKQRPDFKRMLSRNLRKHGLKISQWQNLALPEQPVIKNKFGYGNGCPWVHGRDIDYNDPLIMQNTKDLINRVIWLDEGIQPPNSVKELDYIYNTIKLEVNNLRK